MLQHGTIEVTLQQADISSAADVAVVFGAASSSRPLLAVLHASDVLADAALGNQTLSSLRRVLAAKQPAAWLSAATSQPAASHVLFASVTSLLGSPGQANYSAANAALDAAAVQLQQSGVAAVSVQWGAWAGAGMAAQDAQTAARVERMGMAMIQPERGLAALEGTLCSLSAMSSAAGSSAVMSAVPFKWARMLQRLGPELPSFFAEFAAAAPAAPAVRAAAGRRPRRQRGAPSSDVLAQQVQDTVASILGRQVATDEPLVAAGLDSLGSVELTNALQVRAPCKQ